MFKFLKPCKRQPEVYIEFAKVLNSPASLSYDFAVPVIPHLSYDNVSYDIYPCFLDEYYEIKPNRSRTVPVGICSYCPSDYYFQLHDSRHILEKGVRIKRSIIRSDYRDEWYVTLTNTNNMSVFIARDFNKVLSKNPDAILINYTEPIAQFFVLRDEITNVNMVSLSKLKKR